MKKPLLIFLMSLLVLVLFAAAGFAHLRSAGAARSWPTYSIGASGENVASMQAMLNAHGAALTVDGDFGPGTQSAVSNFQSAHGLSVDGVVGPQTWEAVIVSSSQGSSGSQVSALQRQLNVHGAALTVDGAFGPATASALKSYQSAHGMAADGVASLDTWSSLVGSVTGSDGTPPSATTSWYKSTLDATTSNSEGCQAAQSPSGLVVLDYGQSAFESGLYGTKLFSADAQFVSDNQIQANVNAFLDGANRCTTAATSLHVAIGTSNYHQGTGALNSEASFQAAGLAWALLVNATASHIQGNTHITVEGADDIEIGYSNFSLAKAFVSGYDQGTSHRIVDYGDDPSGTSSVDPDPANGWTAASLWYITSGAPNHVVIPEIYLPAQAIEWTNLTAWACQNKGRAISFYGTMADGPFGGHFTADDSWKQLHRTLTQSPNSCVQNAIKSLTYSTNIHS